MAAGMGNTGAFAKERAAQLPADKTSHIPRPNRLQGVAHLRDPLKTVQAHREPRGGKRAKPNGRHNRRPDMMA